MRKLLVASFCLVVGQGAFAEEFPDGADVRVNVVDMLNEPGMAVIYPDYEACRSETTKAFENIDSDKPLVLESMLFVSHNTPAKVVRTQWIQFKGKSLPTAQITLKAGPFRGKQFWIATPWLRRESVTDPALKRKTLGALVDERRKKLRDSGLSKSDPPPAEKEDNGPQIVLTDASTRRSETGAFLYVEGRLKNISPDTIKGVSVKALFEDPNGKLLFSESIFVDPFILEPDSTATFRVTTSTDRSYDHIKIDLTGGGKSIKWKDETGKRVHP